MAMISVACCHRTLRIAPVTAVAERAYVHRRTARGLSSVFMQDAPGEDRRGRCAARSCYLSRRDFAGKVAEGAVLFYLYVTKVTAKNIPGSIESWDVSTPFGIFSDLLATVFAARHDGSVQALTKIFGHFRWNFVGSGRSRSSCGWC